MVTPAAGARPSVLSLNITSKSALYAAYMPFLERGGLFVPTTREYLPGDEIFMLVALMDDPARLPIAGTVVWVTPSGAQGNKPQGIGHPAPDGGQWRRCRALRWRHLGAISCRA